MGFEVNSLNFLLYVQQVNGRSKFEKVATMGRQFIKALPRSYLKLLQLDTLADKEYCEELLIKKFGAVKVDSFDNSKYEDATFVVDMNLPIPEKYAGEISGAYDIVIDFGTLEHIYNVPQALWNMSTLCKTGGDIVHVLPANGWVGHGFYQFSPELFYTVYSDLNGYSGTEVFLANCDDDRYIYLVRKPVNGVRSCAEGDGEAYILVRTTKMSNELSHNNIQQSDFSRQWEAEVPRNTDNSKNTPQRSKLRQWAKTIPLFRELYAKWHRKYMRRYEKINNKNLCLTKFKVADLLRKV